MRMLEDYPHKLQPMQDGKEDYSVARAGVIDASKSEEPLAI